MHSTLTKRNALKTGTRCIQVCSRHLSFQSRRGRLQKQLPKILRQIQPDQKITKITLRTHGLQDSWYACLSKLAKVAKVLKELSAVYRSQDFVLSVFYFLDFYPTYCGYFLVKIYIMKDGLDPLRIYR